MSLLLQLLAVSSRSCSSALTVYSLSPWIQICEMSRKKLFEMEPGGTVLYLYALREISRENRNL